MRTRDLAFGALLLTMTAMSWGGMFQVAKATLPHLDAFWLNSLRYAVTAPILIAVLVATEGRGAVAFEGKAWLVVVLGSLGFAGFSILALAGLAHSRPEHGALIMSLMPLVTALIGWAWKGVRPSAITLACVGAAATGVAMVVSQGLRGHTLAGSAGRGELMILLGVVGWVLYTLGTGRRQFPGLVAAQIHGFELPGQPAGDIRRYARCLRRRACAGTEC